MSDVAKLQLVISGNAKGAEQALKALGQNMKGVQGQGATLGQSLKGVGTQGTGLSQSLKNLFTQSKGTGQSLMQLQAQGANLGQSLNSMNVQTIGLGKSMGTLGSGLASGIGMALKGLAVGVAAAGAALVGVAGGFGMMTNSAAQSASEVERLVRVTGMGVEKASELRAGAQVLGVEMGALDSAIQGMIGNFKSLNSADNPFRMLGIQVVDGKGHLKDFGGILDQTLDKLQKMGPTAAREMFASKIFGGATPELLRMIDSGSAGLKKASASAKGLGLVITPEQIQASIQYQQATRQVGQAWEGLKLTIGTAVMPMLTQLMQKLVEGARVVIPAVREALKPIGAVFSQLWNVGTNLWMVLSRMWQVFIALVGGGQRLENIGKAIREVFRFLANTLKGLSEALTHLKERIQNTDIAAAMSELWQGIKKAAVRGSELAVAFLTETLPLWGSAIGKFLMDLGNKLMSDSVTGDVASGAYHFGEKFGDVLVAALLGAAKFLINVAPGLIRAIWGVMTQVLVGLGSLLVGFGKEMVTYILMGFGFKPEDFASIKNAMSTWWNGAQSWFQTMGTDIAGAVSAAWTWSSDTWNSIWTSLSGWFDGKMQDIANIGTGIAGTLAGAWQWTADAWNSISASLSDWWNGKKSIVEQIGRDLASAAMNWIIDKVNAAIDAVNRLIGAMNRIPGVNIPAIPGAPSSGGGSPSPGGGSTPSVSDPNQSKYDSNPGLYPQPPSQSEIDANPGLYPPGTGGGSPDSGAPPYNGPSPGGGSGGGSGRIVALARGGVLMPRPGGHIINAAEAGKPEAVLPLDPAVFRQLGLGGGSGVMENHIHVYLDSREIAKFVRRLQMDDLKMQKQMSF